MNLTTGSDSKDASTSGGEQLLLSDDCCTISTEEEMFGILDFRSRLIVLEQVLHDFGDETRNLVNATLSHMDEQIYKLSNDVEIARRHGLMLESYVGALICYMTEGDQVQEQCIDETARGMYEEMGLLDISSLFGPSDLESNFECS